MTYLAVKHDRRKQPQRRIVNERRSFKERRNAGKRTQGVKPRYPGNFPLIVELLCMALVAVAGLTLYKATGLCDAVNSTVGHIAVGGGIIWGFLIAFRYGLHRT